MRLNSKLFDRVRVKPRQKEAPPRLTHTCSWPGCSGEGGYRAPVGRHAENSYRWFCLEHVRQYNSTYNYFSGMSNEEIAAYQKAALTGLRPTWSIGPGSTDRLQVFDSLDIPDAPWRSSQSSTSVQRRPLRPLERRALETLNLEETASLNEIRTRYKELVKRHHPDANGGKKDTTDQLIRVIQAYDCLKSAGIC